MSVNIRIEGLEKTLARFDIKKYEPQVQQCFNRYRTRLEEEAKQIATGFKDEGHLVGAIFAESVPLGVVFGCSINYASFKEFGIRKFAEAYVSILPLQWQELAAKSKGSIGGSFEEMVARITGWVHRKGITGTYSVKTQKRTGGKSTIQNQDKQAAYAIAISILKNGSPAEPFLYPAYNHQTPILLKEFDEIKL